jgi:8-oxo-dGTP pyrophosphatase MutT (NUDIX family)
MPHIHEKIDLTVEVFVVYENRVLLRKHDKYGIWLSVGGHVELDEDPNQAALREVMEEVGLAVRLCGGVRRDAVFVESKEGYTELIPPMFLNRHTINNVHEHVTMTYAALSDTETINTSEHEKSEGMRWFTRAEVENEKELMPHIRAYALEALNITEHGEH